MINHLEQQLIYDHVRDSFALRAEINASLEQRAKGDVWDKLILGLQYRALASWDDQLSNSAAPPPPGADEARPQLRPPPRYYRRPSNLQSQSGQRAQQPPIDYARLAVTWLEAAARDGLAAPRGAGRSADLPFRRAGAIAADTLGEIYAFGVVGRVQSRGIAPDYVTAYVWFSLAAGQKEANAAANLKDVTEMLSAAQLAEARKRLQALNPATN